MRCYDLMKWIKGLKEQEENKKNIELQRIIVNLYLYLSKPYDSFTINKIQAELNKIVELDADLASKKEQRIVYPSQTAGQVFERMGRKDKEEEFKISYQYDKAKSEIINKIDNHIAKLKTSGYNLFLRSASAKIEALNLLKEYLENPEEKAPGTTTICELIIEWKHSKSFKDSKERVVTTGTVLAEHRNIFFSNKRDKTTSTEAFISNLIFDKLSDTKINAAEEQENMSLN